MYPRHQLLNFNIWEGLDEETEFEDIDQLKAIRISVNKNRNELEKDSRAYEKQGEIIKEIDKLIIKAKEETPSKSFLQNLEEEGISIQDIIVWTIITIITIGITSYIYMYYKQSIKNSAAYRTVVRMSDLVSRIKLPENKSQSEGIQI